MIRGSRGINLITLVIGDIVTQETEAIVNAANEMLAAGSGVSGAIHAAAGSHLELECLQLGRCPPGEARITLGYKLKARFVIHAVAPRYWDGTRGEAMVLRQTYTSIFELAVKNKISSIAIPAIGTGIYRYPMLEATEIAFDIAAIYSERLDIRFVCFDLKAFEIYTNVGERLGLVE